MLFRPVGRAQQHEAIGRPQPRQVVFPRRRGARQAAFQVFGQFCAGRHGFAVTRMMAGQAGHRSR
eukprot:1681441-Lingulodinium_polyedra.AAC.1